MAFLFVLFFLGMMGVVGLGALSLVAWLYRKFIKREDVEPWRVSELQIELPQRFGWTIGLLLAGFHLGLYPLVMITNFTPSVPAAGWMVFSILGSSALAVLLWPKRTWWLCVLLGVQVISGIGVWWRANGFVQTWDMLFYVFSSLLLYVMAVRGNLPSSLRSWMDSIGKILLTLFAQTLGVFFAMFAYRKNGQVFFSWIKTFVIGVVVLAVFLGILSSADPVFSQMVEEFRSQIVGRSLWTVAILFLGSVWLSMRIPTDIEHTEEGWLSYTDMITVLGVVVAVVGLFLGVQAKYLFFGNHELLVTLGLTFSEYVRKGFTELLLAVFLGGLISFFAGVKVHATQSWQRTRLGILNTVLLGEMGLLLLSALKRDMLYVDTYGLTRVRVVGEVFLVWLALFIVVLLAYGWRKLSERMSFIVISWAAMGVIVWLNVVNIDLWVSRGAPAHQGYTDFFYLMQLSEDSSAIWFQHLGDIDYQTHELLSKKELSDQDKAQLAGLKLAIISFIERRDRLYTQYADEQWLLDHQFQLGLTLPKEKNMEDYAWTIGKPILSPLSDESQSQRYMPKSLQKARVWQFSSWSERQAYEMLVAHEMAAFDVERILHQIINYQVKHQLSLYTQENKLLHELEYQFINVGLKRYTPSQLQTVDLRYPGSVLPQIQETYAKIATEDLVSVRDLVYMNCDASFAVSFPVHGVLQLVVPQSASSEAILLRPLNNPQGAEVTIMRTPTTRVGYSEDASDYVYGNMPLEFVEAYLHEEKNMTGEVCVPKWVADEIWVYKGF